MKSMPSSLCVYSFVTRVMEIMTPHTLQLVNYTRAITNERFLSLNNETFFPGTSSSARTMFPIQLSRQSPFKCRTHVGNLSV